MKKPLKHLLIFLTFITLGSISSLAELSHEEWARNTLLEAKKIIADAQEDISQDMGCPSTKEKLLPTSCSKGDQNFNSRKQENLNGPALLVFVSFTLPKEALQTLVESVQKAGGMVVIRGLIDNSFVKTAALLKDLKGSVQLDPKVFEKYHIKSVPTFVLEEGDKQDRLTGNVSLDYVLEKFTQQGEVKGADRYLNRLRGKKS